MLGPNTKYFPPLLCLSLPLAHAGLEFSYVLGEAVSQLAATLTQSIKNTPTSLVESGKYSDYTFLSGIQQKPKVQSKRILAD